MHSFRVYKAFINAAIVSACTACSQNQDPLPANTQLTLKYDPIEFEIDESGFSPRLLGFTTLRLQRNPPWPHVWVAFRISMHINNQPLADITQSKIMTSNEFSLQFEQTLPTFGIKQDTITITLHPLGWIPSYPLDLENSTTIEHH